MTVDWTVVGRKFDIKDYCSCLQRPHHCACAGLPPCSDECRECR
jgi:hypothetical protein